MMILLLGCKTTPASSSWACEVLPIKTSSDFKLLTSDKLMKLNAGDEDEQRGVVVAATNNRDILTKETAIQIVNADDSAKVNCP